MFGHNDKSHAPTKTPQKKKTTTNFHIYMKNVNFENGERNICNIVFLTIGYSHIDMFRIQLVIKFLTFEMIKKKSSLSRKNGFKRPVKNCKRKK